MLADFLEAHFFRVFVCHFWHKRHTPFFGDWHSVNAGQLATSVHCYQLLLLIEVVASLLHINLLSPSSLSPLINLYKIPEYGIS